MSDHRSPADVGQTASNVGNRMHDAYGVELRAYHHARKIGDWQTAWRHLERAHIVAQPRLWLHMSSHAAMLTFAFAPRDILEILGQLLRIALGPLGALSGRLPTGNTGRARAG